MGDPEGFSKSGVVCNGTDDAEDKGIRNRWHNSLTMRRSAVINCSSDNTETVAPSMRPGTARCLKKLPFILKGLPPSHHLIGKSHSITNDDVTCEGCGVSNGIVEYHIENSEIEMGS